MNLNNRIRNFIKRRQEEYERGKIVTEQMRAERMRKALLKLEPGTIGYGLLNKQDPIEFMKDAYARRKYKRETRGKEKN